MTSTITEETKALGRYLARLRERSGRTKKEIQRRARISHSALAAIEYGQRAPSARVLARLARALI